MGESHRAFLYFVVEIKDSDEKRRRSGCGFLGYHGTNEEIPSVISGLDAFAAGSGAGPGERARAGGDRGAFCPFLPRGSGCIPSDRRFICCPESGYSKKHGFSGKERILPKEPLAKLLRQGDVEPVGERLERPYTIYGRVIHGRQVGRAKLGIPTANLRITGRLLPEGGVYLSRVWLGDRAFLGVTNLGQNPTVGETWISLGGNPYPKL